MIAEVERGTAIAYEGLDFADEGGSYIRGRDVQGRSWGERLRGLEGSDEAAGASSGGDERPDVNNAAANREAARVGQLYWSTDSSGNRILRQRRD